MSYPLLFFGASAFAAATGCYVLSRGKGSLPHTVLAILFGVFAVQTFSQGMQFSTVEEEEILFWSRMGFTMTAFYLPLFVHFTLVFPRKKIVLDRKAHPLFRFIPKFVFDLDGWLISKWRYFIPMLYAPWLGIAALYILRFDLVRPQISHFWYGTEVLLLSWNFVLLLGALLLLYSGYILSNLITSYLRSASAESGEK